jgi:hypothetical protein
MQRGLAFAVVIATLAGCALEAPEPGRGCPVAGQARMTMLKMYFGRGGVDEAAWAAFRDRVIAGAFPDGFTITDATGAWRPGPDAATVQERASVLEAAVPRGGPDMAAKASQVAEAYKTQFAQLSVGVVTWTVCGGF